LAAILCRTRCQGCDNVLADRPVAHLRDYDRCVWSIGGRSQKYSWRDCLIVTLHYQISLIGSNPCLHSEKVASGWPGTWRRRPCYLYSNSSIDKYCKCLENCVPYRNAHSLKMRYLYLGVLNSD